MRHVIAIAAVPVALAISYGFALLGHPSAVWLWRDMLGVLSR